MEGPESRLSDSQLRELFDRMFPDGFAARDVLHALAPEGWEQSPLLLCFHPTPVQLHEEAVRSHNAIERLHRLLRGSRESDQADSKEVAAPTLDDTRAAWNPTAVQWRDELQELIGLCLWDVFSDNHEVITADGRVADIGSFRGAAGFIDEYLSQSPDDFGWNYMRFYMGTAWICDRADLTSVYELIFRRLQTCGADWICAIRDPGEADAPNSQSPTTVRAYRAVFGRDPQRWQRRDP